MCGLSLVSQLSKDNDGHFGVFLNNMKRGNSKWWLLVNQVPSFYDPEDLSSSPRCIDELEGAIYK